MHIFRIKVPTKGRRHIEINFQKENNKTQFIAQSMHTHTQLTNVTCVYQANNNLYGYFMDNVILEKQINKVNRRVQGVPHTYKPQLTSDNKRNKQSTKNQCVQNK